VKLSGASERNLTMIKVQTDLTELSVKATLW